MVHSSIMRCRPIFFFFYSFLFAVHMLSFLQAVAELGPVDMLVNSAGISLPGEFDNLSIDQYRVSIDMAFDFCKCKPENCTNIFLFTLLV